MKQPSMGNALRTGTMLHPGMAAHRSASFPTLLAPCKSFSCGLRAAVPKPLPSATEAAILTLLSSQGERQRPEQMNETEDT